ncbi:RagB/SusD family nutrient uptake outer membrane protein [Flexithrix dorotheae]|uniref:RagB/SusD family nutrient uptake outer membrane protein n=1 Tax=Flexithrix dorotheae TaxID=70993 RepID=UPI00037ABC5C|nr:RagB/SusD family nutrient uptake outer membrane protein [Flexithrix dorotheae]
MNLYIKIGLSALVMLFFTSCDNEEYFELENPPQAPWQSLNDLEKAPIGAYYGLTGNGGSRTIFGVGRLAGEAFADGVNIAPAADGFSVDNDTEDLYNRTQAGNQVGLFDNSIFNSGYFAVGFANGALDFIENANNDPFPEANRPDEVARIKGELLFVRAYAYYWIARLYLPVYPSDEKKIPFRVNQATNFDEAIASPLASANDIYPLIVEDLKAAKELLPEKFDPALHPAPYEDGRVNKFGAAALLAKVHFHMGNQTEALSELNFVIDQNGGEYDLSEEPIEAWNKSGIERGREVIWYYTLWAGDGLGGSSNWKHPTRFSWYSAGNRDSDDPSKNGARFVTASESFLKQAGWMNADGSENPDALNDKRYTQLFSRFESGADPREQFNTTKPYVWSNKYYRSGVRRSTNLPILRLADMYLLRATVNALNGNTGQARTDLNMVRNRAGLGDFAGTDGDLLEAIEMERMVELAFEGDRLYYLQGLKKDIPNGDRGAGSVPYNGNFYSEVPDYEVELNQGYTN